MFCNENSVFMVNSNGKNHIGYYGSYLGEQSAMGLYMEQKYSMVLYAKEKFVGSICLGWHSFVMYICE